MMSDDRSPSEYLLHIFIATSLGLGWTFQFCRVISALVSFALLLYRVKIVKIWRIAEAYSWEDGYFILDIRDCPISPNLSHFLPELIPGRPGTTIILRKLDCGDQSKIAKTLPIILQKYWCQPEVRFIFLHLRECNFEVYTRFY